MTLARKAIDPSYGYDLSKLLKLTAPPEPTDFTDFWRATYEQTLGVPLRISKRRVNSPDKKFTVYEVEFDSLGEVRIGGWITVPKDRPIERGVVVGHGYGGRSDPSFDLPGPGAAAIFPCARGFHRSENPKIPGQAVGHVIHGIEARETYVHRGCAAELWSAASVLLELYPEVEKNLQYSGGSFGGGIGGLSIPWDARFKKAYLDVPSFGNHPVRLKLKCSGSGESVRLYHKKHPEIAEVLRYFDSAISAKHFNIPVYVSAALSDPAVPPPGQFTVYNSIPGSKELFVRQTGHPNTAEDDRRLGIELDKWFAALS